MHQLTVIGLGAADFDQLQMGVYKQLKQAKKLYVRTEDHPVLHDLKEEGIIFSSFDHVYEKHDTFAPVYKEIAALLIEAAKEEAKEAEAQKPSDKELKEAKAELEKAEEETSAATPSNQDGKEEE